MDGPGGRGVLHCRADGQGCVTGQLDMFAPGAARAAEPEQKPTPSAKPLTIAERFEAFNLAHPEVLTELLRLARVRLASGETRISVKALWEDLRASLEGEFSAVMEASGDSYRLNNNHTAMYARALIDLEPGLSGVIELRIRKAK